MCGCVCVLLGLALTITACFAPSTIAVAVAVPCRAMQYPLRSPNDRLLGVFDQRDRPTDRVSLNRLDRRIRAKQDDPADATEKKQEKEKEKEKKKNTVP